LSIWRYSWALVGGLIGQILGGWDGYLLCLTAFVILDYSAMIFFYLANEGLSIIENLAALGVPIPKRLKQVVAELGEEDPPPG